MHSQTKRHVSQFFFLLFFLKYPDSTHVETVRFKGGFNTDTHNSYRYRNELDSCVWLPGRLAYFVSSISLSFTLELTDTERFFFNESAAAKQAYKQTSKQQQQQKRHQFSQKQPHSNGLIRPLPHFALCYITMLFLTLVT